MLSITLLLTLPWLTFQEPNPAEPGERPCPFESAADYSEAHGGRALLVLEDGKIRFERYAGGWNADRPHPLASGTKSFVGPMALAALADGLFEDLDQPASTWIEAWREPPRRAAITLRHLLELTSGLSANHPSLGPAGWGVHGLLRDSQPRLELGRRAEPPADRFAAALALPHVFAPGRRFDYGAGHFFAFGAVLEAALAMREDGPKTAFEYLRERVLLPAGVDVGLDRFHPDAGGKPGLAGSAHLTAREWARFGEWVRLGGATRTPQGELTRDLPEGLLDALFVPGRANPQYGLTWWLFTGEPGAVADVGARFSSRRPPARTEALTDGEGTPIPIHVAAGAGKQRLYLIPTCSMVVVRFGRPTFGAEDFDDQEFLKRLLGL